MRLFCEAGKKVAYLKERLIEVLRPVAIGAGWGICIATIILWAIFQGLLLPNASGGLPYSTPASSVPVRMTIYYLALVLVSVLFAMAVHDLGKSLGAYLLAYLLSGVIVYSILVSPEVNDPVFGPGYTVVVGSLTFQALFPFTLFVGFLATIVGYGLSERILG